ncbi:MAG: VOC family protein [Verrucomicrobiota bacterium]|nr:VOC family protein [Verrucomicrobiota bacterium]
MFELEGIDHVALAVRDVPRSAQWFIDVLGFEHRHAGMWNGEPVFVGKGSTAVALFRARSDAPSATRAGERIGMMHLAFRASRADFVSAQDELTRRRIAFDFQDHEISHSIYFPGPDGMELEITTYDVPNGNED